jgi:hypothetical protein
VPYPISISQIDLNEAETL